MPTTSLKLPDEVKKLAAAAAKQQGISPHAFMVDAIRAAAVAAEKRAAFVANAVAARDDALKSGKAHEAAEVQAYIQERARGRKLAKPKATPWRG